MSSSTNTSREQSRDKSSDHDSTGSLPHGKKHRESPPTQPPPRQPPPASEYSSQQQETIDSDQPQLPSLPQQWTAGESLPQQRYLLEQQYLQRKYLLKKQHLQQKYLLKKQYLLQHGVLPPSLPQEWRPGQSPPQQQYPPEQSSSSVFSPDEIQHGDLTSSLPLSPLSHSEDTSVDSSLDASPSPSGKACEEGDDHIVPPQPLKHSPPPQPSTQQEVWLTIQNYSMFLNTMSPQSRENIISTQPPCTRTFFTLCSLAKYISQFDLTDPDAHEKAETDKEFRMYYNLYSEFPPATLTVTMTLHFLFNAPHMYLPLAPFRNAIYSAVEFASMFQFAHGSEMLSFETICRLVTGIFTMRIRNAVGHLYPRLRLAWGDTCPKLEGKRPPILGWLARDTLAAFNPIEIILMYYRPIITEFKQITNPTEEDCRIYFQKITSIAPWLHSMHSICMMYGLHIYDSKWVSIEEWRELAGYMNTILTKIAPDLFDVVQGKHPDPATDEEDHHIVFTKDWYVGFLACLAPCFTHHYRPMGEPRQYKVPYGNWPQDISKLSCYIIPSAYSDMLANLPTALEQYATMYVEDPTQFEREGSQSLSHDTDGNNPFTITPSSIRSEFDDMMEETSPKRVKEPYTFKNTTTVFPCKSRDTSLRGFPFNI